MVLVPVGEEDRLDVLGALTEVGEVGQDQVDAELVGRRERQPGVHHHHAAAVLDDGHVLADLAQAAQRQDAEGVSHLNGAQETLLLERFPDRGLLVV